MAQVATAAPSREDFASMIEESFGNGHLQEGSVVKGTVVGIEKDVAVIDVGTQDRGPRRATRVRRAGPVSRDQDWR